MCSTSFSPAALIKPGEAMHDFPGCQATCIPCRPESRGWLRIRSPDPAAPPAIQPNYLSTQADKDTLVAGLRIARTVFQSPAMAALVTGEFLPGRRPRPTSSGSTMSAGPPAPPFTRPRPA